MKINNNTLSLILAILLVVVLVGGGIWINNLKNQEYIPDTRFDDERDSILQVQEQWQRSIDSTLKTLHVKREINNRNITNSTNIILNEIDKADSIKPILYDRHKLLHSANSTGRTYPTELLQSEGFDNIQQ